MNDTRCRKCGAEMTPMPKPTGTSPIDLVEMKITGYRCNQCGHWNNLKPRKAKPVPEGNASPTVTEEKQ